MTQPTHRFRPSQRMHTPKEYESVFGAKHSAGDAVLLVFVSLRGDGPTRLGTSVGKRLGNSVVRHAWKRAIREAFRLLQHQLPLALDVVVVPRPGAKPVVALVQESLPKLIERAAKKARRLPPASPPPEAPDIPPEARPIH